MTLRRARLCRALIWPVSVLIITVIATASFHLLASVLPDWWWPVLELLPDYLVPEYSTADLPPVLLTILAAATLLVGSIRLVATKVRHPQLRPLTAAEVEALTPKEHFDALIAERGARLQRWSTWGVMFGLLFTAGSLVYTARSLETSQEGQITDRYTKAIEQLGSAKIDVRLGAIYALQRLAQDSERDRETITNVLAAYVREHDPKPKAKPPEHPDTDVYAAVIVLSDLYPEDDLCSCDLTRVRIPGAQLQTQNLHRWLLQWADLSRANLIEADLRSAELRGANLTEADLRNADLTGADLTEARLIETNLDVAILNEASLTKASLSRAKLEWAQFYGADLIDATLIGADLNSANLTEAALIGADLSRANLTGAALSRANLTGADLTGADLTGADLTGADLTGADLTGAKTDATTKLPS